MKKFYIFLVSVILIFSFISCATIFKGSSQNINIMSTPDKATISIKTMSGIEVYNGITPASITLAKKHEYLVNIKLAGYKESITQVSQSLQGWFWGNLLCGGVVGMLIDYFSGAMWDLEPETINISLLTANNNGNESETYAVFRALDNEGQPRMLIIPLIKESGTVAIK